MVTLVAIAVGVPCLGLLAFVGMRRIRSMPFARSLALDRADDTRGIALQTIIIMVVLLAIAGSVAAVLLNRAGQETARLDETRDVWASITDFQGCRIANGRPSTTPRTGTFAAASDQAAMNSCFPPP